MNQAFLHYYRCPSRFVDFRLVGELSPDSGYFRFCQDAICYGQCSSGFRSPSPTGPLHDAFKDLGTCQSIAYLPFDPTQVVENLRRERYVSNTDKGRGKPMSSPFLRNTYYFIRPIIPLALRKHLQRIYLSDWDKIAFPNWPVDLTVERIIEKLMLLSLRAQMVEKIPFIWFWPHGFSSCAIMTHDVETSAGRDFCSQLMDLDDSFEIKSSFQIVPEGRYSVTQAFLDSIRGRGFEIDIHDLNHDGLLFSDREQFLRRVRQINRYAKEYGAIGYRSAVLYRNFDWYDAFDVSYDMSVPNAAHLEPQRGGCCTVMPYFIGDVLELPVTTTQDYSLFHILNVYSIELWRQQIALIMKKYGLVSFIVHPDYLIGRQERDTYQALLRYLSQLRSESKVWITLPGEVNRWWRERSQMTLVEEGGKWRIEGPARERARIAFATLADGNVVYEIEQQNPGMEQGRAANENLVGG